MTTRNDRYSSVAVLLHWIIALSILFQIILGWRMGDNARSAATYLVFQLHKSVGITILLVSLVRLGWRLSHRAPPLPAHLKTWERHLAHLTHVLFYIIMIGLPITGWIMVSASKTNIPTLLYGTAPWPHLPWLPELAAGPKQVWHKVGEVGHGFLAKLTYALLALHVGGALKHQLIDRDATLSRMIPGVKAGAWFDLRALALAAAAIASIGLGYAVFSGAKPAPKPVAAPAAVAPVDNVITEDAPVTGAKPGATSSATLAPLAAPPAPPPVWAVDKGAVLGFETTWSGQPVTGHFEHWTADIRFSPEALAASTLSVTIDPASVSTGDPQRDATLPTEDWFNAAKFPRAVFTAKHFRKAGERYVADGVLNLKGVSKPVKLAFSLSIDGDKATASGTAQLDRTLFGVGQGEYGATDQIPAAVSINFNLTAHKPATAK